MAKKSFLIVIVTFFYFNILMWGFLFTPICFNDSVTDANINELKQEIQKIKNNKNYKGNIEIKFGLLAWLK